MLTTIDSRAVAAAWAARNWSIYTIARVLARAEAANIGRD